MDWIEQRLSELADEGFFDDLPGSGQPIADIDKQYSPVWWTARWVERDAARRGAESVERRMAEDVAEALTLSPSEARERLVLIKRAVDALNAHLDSTGQLPHFDVDTVLIRRQWSP